MSHSKALIALAALSLSVGLWASWPSQAAGTPNETSKIRLYSNGQVVGEWIAVGRGQVEGDTLVFSVRKGVRDVEVRISGTYSAELQP